MRFLFVDRILQLKPAEYIQGIKHITQDDYYLTQDVSQRVCFISSFVGETIGQLAAWNVMHHHAFKRRPVAGVVAKAQLHRPAYLGETLLLEAQIESVDEAVVRYHGTARVGDEIIFRLENALGPLLPMAQFIDQDTVQQQFSEIYRPVSTGDNKVLSKRASMGTDRHGGSEADIHLIHLCFDRIVALQPGQSITAEKCITRSASYFPDHFPRSPVLPLTVLLESKINLAQTLIAQSSFSHPYRLVELQKIKMNEFVQPGDILTCHARVKHQDDEGMVISFKSEVDGKRVCVADVKFSVEGTS